MVTGHWIDCQLIRRKDFFFIACKNRELGEKRERALECREIDRMIDRLIEYEIFVE